MIVYNVTKKVDWSIHEDWLLWIKEEHIPRIMATGFFIEYRMLKLLEIDDSDGPTYAVQYYAPSIDYYTRYINAQDGIGYQIETGKWGNKVVSFSTIMEVVQ
jgi:hypothetical protein